jgi:halocyanin-like protein
MASHAATQTAGDGASSTRRRFLRGAVPAVGAAALGSQGVKGQETATPAQQRPDWGGWLEGIDGGYRDARGEDNVTVRVGASGNGGDFAFGPAGLWVDPGTTVTFQWTGAGGGHNVVARSGPADLDSGDPVDDTGYTYEVTLEEGGITEYVCIPHESLGMLGAIAVGDDVPTVAYEPPSPEGESEGGLLQAFADAPPGTTFVLVLYAAGGLGAAMVLGAEYGGNFYRWRRTVKNTTVDETEEAPAFSAEAELDHDEYDPTGTAALVVVYLAIISLMWVFMYFVEFLGRASVGV